MSKELEVVAEHWKDTLEIEIKELVGVSNTPTEITKPSERKKYVSIRTKMQKLIKSVDDARKASNKEVKESNQVIADTLTALISPLKVEYDELIDNYDESLRLKQEEEANARLAEEKDLLDSRLAELGDSITAEELEFIDVANMPEDKFEAFVAYRTSIVVERKVPTPVDAEMEELEIEAKEESIEEVVDDSSNTDTTSNSVADAVELEVLTDDDEVGQFHKYWTMFTKIKKPAVIKSSTALATREVIDNLQEMLDSIIPDEYK